MYTRHCGSKRKLQETEETGPREEIERVNLMGNPPSSGHLIDVLDVIDFLFIFWQSYSIYKKNIE